MYLIQRYMDFIKAYFMSSPAQIYSMNFVILRKNYKQHLARSFHKCNLLI